MDKEALEKQAEDYAEDFVKDKYGGSRYCAKVQEEKLLLKIGFKDGHEAGFEDCAKARLNVTTISDCQIKDDELKQAKEIIRMVINSYSHKERFSFEKDLIKAEQFLKEIKEK